jgi:cycloartenol synthase
MRLLTWQDIIGATNHNLMLTYAQFRNIFPIWALGEYYRRVLEAQRD